MLFQHKAELGVKEVHEVTIFRDDVEKNRGKYVEVELLFTIIDLAEGEPEDEKGPGNKKSGLKRRNTGVKGLMYVRKERVGGCVHEIRLEVWGDG